MLFALGCNGEPPEECAVGSEGCNCTAGGGCDLGLVCLSTICVDLESYLRDAGNGTDRATIQSDGGEVDRDAARADDGSGHSSDGSGPADLGPRSDLAAGIDSAGNRDTGVRADARSCTNSLLGNGFCNAGNNTAACNWDDGDCCASTCVSGTFTCGVNGYDCRDPNAGSHDAGSSVDSGGAGCHEFATGSTFYTGDDVYVPCNQFPPTNCRTGRYIWFDGDQGTCYCALRCDDFDPVKQIGQSCDVNGDTTCYYVQNATNTSNGNWCLPQNWFSLDLDCSR